MSRRHLVADPRLQTLIGAGFFLAAAYLIWDSYEGRGRRRPFAASLLLP